MSRRSTIPVPTLAQIRRLSEDMGYKCTDVELDEYRDLIESSLKDYTRIFDLPEPKLPVKYTRDIGSNFKPTPEENPCNAWALRTDIRGASNGKLVGKRIAVKDNIQIAGVPMSNGSELLRGFVPTEDATVITRVLDAGGHIVGTTNVNDMCADNASQSCLNGPVLNPHDKTRSAGGSSSGSAVALVLEEADMAFGGDQGGSIRFPASQCGIVGLKPTHGLVPYTGVIPVEATIDHIGPMARTVKDCALMLEVIAGYDNGLDHRQPSDIAVPLFSENLKLQLTGRKIGFVTESFANCSEEVISVVKDSFKYFTDIGIIVEEVSIPLHSYGKDLFTPFACEGSTFVMMSATEMGVKGYKSSALADHLFTSLKTKFDFASKLLKAATLTGKYILETVGTSYYAKACNIVRTVNQAYDDQLAKYDVLLMPTIPRVAPKLITKTNPSPKESESLVVGMRENTAIFNLTGHPALSINAGYNKDKLPIGLSIVGKHFDEQTVLAYAYAFEQQRENRISGYIE